jgi:hypothetical protein
MAVFSFDMPRSFLEKPWLHSTGRRFQIFLTSTLHPLLGAARNADYDEMQRAFSTGYKKFHGIKYESILLPNGLVTLFGPVSARHSDRGVQLMTNINRFLVNLQNGVFSVGGKPVFFSVLGDSAYQGGLR